MTTIAPRLALLFGAGLILSASSAQALQVCREPFYSGARPSAEAMALAYPERAMREHVQGRTVLNCAERWDGRLDRCVVKSESPLGYGFGQAALRLAPKLHSAPAALRIDAGCARNGGPDRRIDTTILFNMAG